MVRIVVGTTPTFKYNFKIIDPSDIVTAYLTIKRDDEIIFEKTLDDAVVGDDSLSWTFTQEETLAFGKRSASVMINWVTKDGKRGVSPEETVRGVSNHKEEII